MCTPLTDACLLPREKDASVPSYSACFNLFSFAGENVMLHLESAKPNNPCDCYDVIIIKSNLLRKPLHYLI